MNVVPIDVHTKSTYFLARNEIYKSHLNKICSAILQLCMYSNWNLWEMVWCLFTYTQAKTEQQILFTCKKIKKNPNFHVWSETKREKCQPDRNIFDRIMSK